MKKILTQLSLVLTIAFANQVQAAGSALMYIQPMEYTNEVKLQHYAKEYWFAQGPMVEAIAKETLTTSLGEVSMCEGNQTGKMLVWLQPRMFYNGQLQVFYGQITANVYTGIGQLVGSYVGEASQQGSLGIAPEVWLNKAYTTAMEAVQAKMQADAQLQAVIAQPAASSATDTPCSMVTLLPVPKIRAMSF